MMTSQDHDRQIADKADRIDGWIARDEHEWLVRAASTRQVIIEVGSWKGKSTKALALSSPGRVIAIDHWKGSSNEQGGAHQEAALLGSDGMVSVFSRNLKDEIAGGKVIPVREDSASAGPTVAGILRRFGGYADMIFIDGDHTYPAVKRDLEVYAPMVRPGGLFSGHDYQHGFPGVVQAVNERFGRPYQVVGTIWWKRFS